MKRTDDYPGVSGLTASEYERLHPPSLLKRVWDLLHDLSRLGLFGVAVWAGVVNHEYGMATFALGLLILDTVTEDDPFRRRWGRKTYR